MVDIFNQNNIKVNLFHIEKTNPNKINLNNTVGLAFPVAVQSIYPFIWDFIKAFPDTTKTKIFMVDTLHAFSGAIVGTLKKTLQKKGYKTIGAKEIIMPNNFYPSKINPQKKSKKITNGLKEAEKYALSIINGTSEWSRIPILSDIFYFIVSRKYIWKFIAKFGTKFIIDKDKCTKCELCIELCPLQNITMKQYPEYNNKCQQCLRCVMFCPTNAIRMPIWKYKRYRAIEVNLLCQDRCRIEGETMGYTEGFKLC
ncbi:MAG: 4Fe-4S dicluster domain-containing protein [Spirochaetes bacterium]|nr:4Fe-4S dicluster domain-containing protein [Spirochaetota bacterium]